MLKMPWRGKHAQGVFGGWVVVLMSAFYQEKRMAYLWRKSSPACAGANAMNRICSQNGLICMRLYKKGERAFWGRWEVC